MTYDVVVVGGGTAGSLLATRLSEDPDTSVALVEWGPDDRGEERARMLRRWPEMLEGEFDLDYRLEPQQRGNAGIRLARMRLLGGCSNANTMITWRPLPADLHEWVTVGAAGWEPENVLPYYDHLQTRIVPVAEDDRNPYVADVVAAAAEALGVPVQDRWNDGRLDSRAEGVGFFEVGYIPETNQRGATSLDYLHPVMEVRDNLHVLTGLRAEQVLLQHERAEGVLVRDGRGTTREIRANREVVLCCGAVDSPRLLQLSGIGPREVLERAGIDVRVDLPGVGENLQDHAEGLVVWEARRRPSMTCASGWDAGALLSCEGNPAQPDVLMHIPTEPWTVHAEAYGAELPEQIVSLTPNVAKPTSRGRIWVVSADPDQPPAIDPRYFTDADGHDERMLLAGVRAAREIAKFEPFASWLTREVFPGPTVQSDAELSEIARATHQTVYHPCGTCRMGAEDDPMAVLDAKLRVRGVDGLRVVDASVFPSITSVNPVGTVMVIAERAADLIQQEDRSASSKAASV
ncbi:GMC family oxidoreductase [Saccharopolyspora mangrovi]|uniref:GMC family oxidoreductase N-terminal domain-containing protein n=1 Tax=Saccharopolyspora mangrovi TaxID=3082379 RepID=A0ABU6AHR9_9PSEU|nr:GMC oxidoreductase [Saccharopolyspora sp. S2-29]MEB3370919.1 GMC family oxidoreductase N-terminal domain-containing protein [Saccharopolyspora sp. S2-29]